MLKSKFRYLIFFLAVISFTYSTRPCNLRKYPDGYVCVCNKTYCDVIDNVLPTEPGMVIVASSSKGGLRFSIETTKFDSVSNSLDYLVIEDFDENIKDDASVIKIKVEPKKTFQEIIGFGGAFTGAVLYNMEHISDELNDFILKSYFSVEEGIGYTFLRHPIGGCDFDLAPWAYNELPENDINLTNFKTLSETDRKMIPKIEKIREITNNNLKVIGAAWSPPPWMKTNNKWSGLSKLKYEYYKTWSDYHIKYLTLMKEYNHTFWGISTGNEPTDGDLGNLFVKFMCLGWTPNDQATWISEYFGPSIRSSEFKDIKIIGGDDDRYMYPLWFNIMEETNPKSIDYIDVFGVHWYMDPITPISLLDKTIKMYPTKLLLNTESCIGSIPILEHRGPLLGDWNRGQIYLKSMMDDFNHFVNGWVDWNIALDEIGGPNYVNNFVSSPIIVNTTSGIEIYKDPIFYCIGHFSKYVIPGSIKIETQVDSLKVSAISFLRPDGFTVVVINNPSNYRKIIFLEDIRHGTVTIDIPQFSVHTLVY